MSGGEVCRTPCPAGAGGRPPRGGLRVTRGCSTSQRRCSWSGVLMAHPSTPSRRQPGQQADGLLPVTATSAICSRQSCAAGFEIGWLLYRRQPRPRPPTAIPKISRRPCMSLADTCLRKRTCRSAPRCSEFWRRRPFNSRNWQARTRGWLAARDPGRGDSASQFAARGEIKVDDPELAADLFLNLLLGHSTRLACTASRSTRSFWSGGDGPPSSSS